MKRVLSRRVRRPGDTWCVLGLFVLGACSGACGGGGGGTGDSGFGNDDSGNRDSGHKSDGGSKHDGGSNSDGTMSSDTGSETSTGSTDGASDSGSDATSTFKFDGFAPPDGFNPDAPVCPDDDGDGFVACGPGCPKICDCDDHNSLVNPCAFDTNAASGDPVGMDGIDNDCDGKIDNLHVCDGPAPSSPAKGVTYDAVSGTFAQGHDTTASDYANASDICDNPQCKIVMGATWYGPNNSEAHRITPHMGGPTPNGFVPQLGAMMSFLSDGIADDDIDDPGGVDGGLPLYRTGDGTDLGNTFTNPHPFTSAENTNPCGIGTAETATTPAVHDYTELRLTLRAPRNAGGFSFAFNFFSEEYPYYVCAGFNDHFLALLTSRKYPTTKQISFDASGHPIDVNNSFFTYCNGVTTYDTIGFPGTSSPGTTYAHACSSPLSQLTGTSYEIPYCCSGLTNGNDNFGSGATGWLTTTAPIWAGETFTLSFVVFDEQDGILDSAVNLDSFRWTSVPVTNPITAR
jgi:hypothetical protein